MSQRHVFFRRTASAVLLAAIFSFGAAWSGVGSTAVAQDNDDPVFVFNRICYAQVPDVQSIKEMASRLAWKPITGEDLEKFTTIEKPSFLEGWDVQVGARLYRVAVVQSAPPEGMKKTFPDLADGTSTTCSVVLDGGYETSVFTKNMQTLAGKAPVSKDVPEEDFLVTTWAGGNDKIKVFLISKANIGGQGGLLNVTVLTK